MSHDPMMPGEHPTHTVEVHKAKVVSLQTGATLNGRTKEDKAPLKLRFTLVRFADLKADNEPEYLVPGIIPAEGFGVVWGPPKEGKSFWIFDLLMHVALGWPYRGMEVQQGPIAYCAFEGAAGFKKRATAFRQRHPGADEAEFFLIGGRADLIREHTQLIADIKKQTGDRPPRVVCLDTLNRSLVGSENKDEDMSAYTPDASRLTPKQMENS